MYIVYVIYVACAGHSVLHYISVRICKIIIQSYYSHWIHFTLLHGGSGARPWRVQSLQLQADRADGPSLVATFQVSTPELFCFTHPEEWLKWIRRFERFRVASGLVSRGEEAQVNTLIYAMGDQADDILRSFPLSEEDRKHYITVKRMFDSHFVQRRNVIFERSKFNRRRQEEGESVEAFITALYTLAELCSSVCAIFGTGIPITFVYQIESQMTYIKCQYIMVC